MTGVGLLDGFSGSATGLQGTFTDIDSLIGDGAAATLNGASVAVTYQFGVTNQYLYGGHSLDFAAFGQVNGGTGNDTFAFLSGAAFTGALDGGAGTNTLTYAAYPTVASVIFTSADTYGFAGSSTNAGGTFSFSNLDVFGGNQAVVADSLQGLNADAVFQFNISGDTYTAGVAQASFSGFGKLVGGTGSDLFQFVGPAAIFTGDIDGGAGIDWLDYHLYGVAVIINMGGTAASPACTAPSPTWKV